MKIPQVRRLMYNDEEIGMGFNSRSGLAVGTALEGLSVSEYPTASGSEVTADNAIVNTHHELMQKLGMAFEAQGRYGFFSASAKANFSESTNYNSTSFPCPKLWSLLRFRYGGQVSRWWQFRTGEPYGR